MAATTDYFMSYVQVKSEAEDKKSNVQSWTNGRLKLLSSCPQLYSRIYLNENNFTQNKTNLRPTTLDNLPPQLETEDRNLHEWTDFLESMMPYMTSSSCRRYCIKQPLLGRLLSHMDTIIKKRWKLKFFKLIMCITLRQVTSLESFIASEI